MSFYIKSALCTLPKLLGSLDLLGGQGRCRGDVGEMQGGCRGDVGEI